MKLLLLSLSIFLTINGLTQVTVNITPDKDNSIYSESGSESNGLGKLYAGATNTGDIRRALMHFDIAGNIPAGSTITAVSLDLNQESAGPGAGADDYNLHPATLDWGEGSSSSTGQGAPAVAPDATWSDAMFGTSFWSTAGGDFIASIATSTLGTTPGIYSWSSAGMVTLVQNWLDVPANNFGWFLIGNETTNGTARRFGSKDQGTAPVLNVTYTCTGTVTASCQSQTVYLDQAGNATLNPADLDNGSSSTCGGTLTFSASQTSFNCSDVNGYYSDLVISGVFDGPLPGGIPKGVELYVVNNITDLSLYGISSANNGGGTTGTPEFTFPAVAATAGTYIYVASESVEFTNFFGFAPDYTTSAANINGDDAMELFFNGQVVDVFGDVDVDGSGEPWEYLDGWAHRVNSTGPNGGNFNISNWTFSGVNQLEGGTTNATCTSPFPLGTYNTPGTTPFTVDLTVMDSFGQSDMCSANLTILDTLPPMVSCISSGTFMLDMSGNLTLTPADIDDGTTDNCALDVLSLSQTAFDCNDLGSNSITLYATDIYGNIDSCTTTITIQDAGGFSITVDAATDPLCFGGTDGTISITVNNGSAPYSYDWDIDGTGDFDDMEDLTGLGAGTYVIEVMDASGCITQETVTLTEPAVFSTSFLITDAVCPGQAEGAIDMTISGGTIPYSFDWDNDGTGDFDDPEDLSLITPGSYIINIIDNNNCMFADTVIVADGILPILSTTVNGTTITSDETNGTYQWVFCPSYNTIPTETNQSITVPAHGDYAVIVTSVTGCTDTSDCVTIGGSGINDLNDIDFYLSPNPASNLVTIKINSAFNGVVNVLDINGRVIISNTVVNETTVIDASQLSNGLYFVELVKDEFKLTKKLIIQH